MPRSPRSRRRGRYGVDGSFHVVSAPLQATGVGAAATGLLIRAGMELARRRPVSSVLYGAAGCGIASAALLYLHATLIGKFEVWSGLLDALHLRGDETLLDMGCGRGAVLCSAAARLPSGRAIGIDLWQADQTGNAPEVTMANAAREAVADRVEVRTGDMTRLPLDDASVDVVVSNLAIHNIPTETGRRAALREAARVLRPGGRLLIADLWATADHAAQLRFMGWLDVRRRNLGWRMWYGGPWAATRLVSAVKPG